MSQSPERDKSEGLVPHPPTLEDAWLKFGEYDKNASLAQKRFINRHALITYLGLLSTILVVLFSIIPKSKTALGLDLTIVAAILRWLIILTPISISVLTAIDIKFNLGLAWIVLRSSAEALKKEIYLYRVQVGIYAPHLLEESRELKLAQRLKIIGQRLMETQLNQGGLEPYRGVLPPYAPEGDDGFSDMGWREYLAWRLEDQFNYYCKKARKLGQQQTSLQWSIAIMGGVGTFLAAMEQEIFVAVSSAFSAALISTLEFRRVETNLVSCNQASNDLYSIRTWWRALSPEAQADQDNLETLVQLTENVIQAENAGWVQEMRDALSDMYGEKDKASDSKPMNENASSSSSELDLQDPDGNPVDAPEESGKLSRIDRAQG